MLRSVILIVCAALVMCGLLGALVMLRRLDNPEITHPPATATVQKDTVIPEIKFASAGVPALPPVPMPAAVKNVQLVAGITPVMPRKTAHSYRPRIVIIIDDMGMDVARSREVINLPPPLTLSFLPYAPKAASLAAQGLARGDELMIHMPMQPINPVLDMGSIALHEGMSNADFDGMLDRAFASFAGYKGMNNHMGSRLTQDPAAMARLMAILKKHDLYFVDSRTIAGSVAADEARKAGLAWASRDVFLDDGDTEASVAAQLHQTEDVARRTGLAIAIGHPRDETIAALRAWLPYVAGKGFVLINASEAVRAVK